MSAETFPVVAPTGYIREINGRGVRWNVHVQRYASWSTTSTF